jgi:hypothetical protein
MRRTIAPRVSFGIFVVLLALAVGVVPLLAQTGRRPVEDGYRGIWYAVGPSKDEYKYKYSGGFATYPQQHVPIAYYSKEANKTFFCYGGTVPGKRELLHMVSYYDHATGKVPRPTILLNKKTSDAHDNPTLMLDDKGHLWIFSSAHGTARPSYIHRSQKPYAIDAFAQVLETNFSYPQPWHLPGHGFLFLHTRYSPGRNLFSMTSADGLTWHQPQPLARMVQGQYQISWRDGTRVGTAFDYHPRPGGLDARTNLYYLETRDQGKTWCTVKGQAVETPLTEPGNAALVHDYEKEKRLVYLKDLAFDGDGRPVILYLTSKGHQSGPANDPRAWHTARWTGDRWDIRPFTTSDHNYDHGALYIEADGTWRVIAPTEPGPQGYGTGGAMVLWTSPDQGRTWTKVKQLTRDPHHNHTYARKPVHAHPDFYALWADGHAWQPSPSCLYFTNKTGDHVWRLPPVMTDDFARPEIAW